MISGEQFAEYPEIITISEEDEIKLNSNAQKSKNMRTQCASVLYSKELDNIKTFKPISLAKIEERKITLGPKMKKLTLCLDLDGTLEFCERVNKERDSKHCWEFSVTIRPFAVEMLKELTELYEIVIFTAAERVYAENIVAIIDPEHKYISKIISNEGCFLNEQGFFIKDLRIFADRDISEILLVDDNVYSFAFQINNGIPVKKYEGDVNDDELYRILRYLKQIYEEKEVTKANKERLWLEN